MNLLIDIGNTSLRWTLQREVGPSGGSGDGLGELGAVRHGGALPIDLLAAWDALEAPRRVLMGNVGGAAVGGAVGRAVRALWGIEAELAATRADALGVRVAYADPSRLGVDRWLALVGARARTGGPCLIVDAGTAVTYDLLLPEGRHLGGLILPGAELMRRSLLDGTGIPGPGPSQGSESEGRSTIEGPAECRPDPWAAETWSAVAAGSREALAALADRLYDRLAERAGSAPTLLLTGGDSGRLAPAIDRPLQLVPDLVLRGLARLAAEDPR
jgi:type III pantothenate kinase